MKTTFYEFWTQKYKLDQVLHMNLLVSLTRLRREVHDFYYIFGFVIFIEKVFESW